MEPREKVHPFGGGSSVSSGLFRAGRVESASPAAEPQRTTRIFAVGGGKGGVGKTFLSCNLGAMMARQGKRVVLVDADLGGANLHTYLGLDFPERTLNDVLARRVDRIEDVVLSTSYPNLKLISGAHSVLGAANPRYEYKARLARKLRDLDADVVILDLGSGTSFNTLDTFLLSDEGVFVVVPEPTSLENAYAFIKASFFRRVRRASNDARIKALVDRVADGRMERSIRTPAELLGAIEVMDPRAGGRLREEVNRFRPHVVMNQVRTVEDIQIGFAIRKVCRKYFGLDVDYLGYVNYDNAVWKSVRRRSLLLTEYPLSEPVEFLGRMAKKLLEQDTSSRPAVPVRMRPGNLQGAG